MSGVLSAARRVLYWASPPVLLYFVFRAIDFERLLEIASGARVFTVVLGNLLICALVPVAALRWRMLLRRCGEAALPLRTSISEYWKSLALGAAVPGSLGSDAYRVMLVGGLSGHYVRNAIIIGVEKIAALFACAALIGALYPVLASDHFPAAVSHLIDALYAIFVLAIAAAVSVLLVRRRGWARRLTEGLNAWIASVAVRIGAGAASAAVVSEGDVGGSRRALAQALRAPAVLAGAVTFSFAILLISAVQAQLYFRALGYDLPFYINVFVTPLLYLLFTLPISFSGIGVREGAFVVLYGAFGVPAETALVVSFCGLVSILLSYAVGACLFLLTGDTREYLRRLPGVIPESEPHRKPSTCNSIE